jgi:hypothetical protein
VSLNSIFAYAPTKINRDFSGFLWQPQRPISNSAELGLSYFQWLLSKHPQNELLRESEMMVAKAFQGTLVTNFKNTSAGSWTTFKISQEIPLGIHYPDVTFLGAIFGLFFGTICRISQIPENPLGIPNLVIPVLRSWLNFSPIPPGIPDYYEISNFAISVVDQNPKETSHNSISTVGMEPLRKALVKFLTSYPEINEFLNHSGIMNDYEAIFRMGLVFSKLLENSLSQLNERMMLEGVVVATSDEPLIFDSVRPKATTLKVVVALYHSVYTKHVPTGCRGLGSALHRIFSKSKKTRAVLLYSPIGIQNGVGENCILQCIAHFLGENQGFDTPSPEEFMQKPDIMVLKDDTINLKDSDVLERINQASKLNIICYYEHISEQGEHTIIDLQWPENNNAEFTLRLLAHVSGSDLFGFPSWHACIVSGFGMLKDKKLCKKCGEWFANNSPHLEKCKVCTKCGKAFVSDGNHYISCKGKKILGDTAKANGVMSPSAIDHKEWQLWRNVWFADFECFQNASGTHIPYMVALKGICQEVPVTFWGKNCLKDFITYITTPANKVTGYLYCHNGSGYDFNLILVGLLQFTDKFKAAPLNVLMRGSKILTCQISTSPPLTLRDTYLVLPAGLGKLCKDLKIKQEFAKTAFDHSKVTSFETADLHKAEIKKYCIQDVKALEQIFKMFSRAMWNVGPVLLQTSMSLASHALELWKIIEAGPSLSSLVLPDMSTYNVLRNMYHGGRVLATLAKYDSVMFDFVTEEDETGNFTFFDEDGVSLMDFEEIKKNIDIFPGKECIKQLDVVSLYPYVMYAELFPVGGFIEVIRWLPDSIRGEEEAQSMTQIINGGKWATIEHDGEIIRAENPAYGILKEEMFRMCYEVDMDCPKDAIVAFLMRKVDDTPVQNLAPLRNHWVTGVELFEAIKVGYTLLRINAKFGWASRASIFRKYIGVLFKIKEDNKKDKSSVMYLVAKLLMNALSGKFGQKIVSDVTRLLSELPEDPDKMFENLLNVRNQIIEAIDETQKSLPVGFIFTSQKPNSDLETNLPTHLSVFILAHSRRKMSKMLRFVNGYYDKENTIMYTDTDSMVVREHTFNLLKNGKFIGGKLGQLEDEFPNEIIVAGRFLAPKVYVLMMLKQLPNSPKCAIAYKVRCKGIPHRGDVFFANSYVLDEREFKVRLDEINDSVSGPVADLGKRFYVVKDKKDDQPVLVQPFINISTCDLILSEKFYLQIHFGSILKNSKIKFSLQSKWVTRSLGFNSWWNNPLCPRVLKDEEGYEITGCKSV